MAASRNLRQIRVTSHSSCPSPKVLMFVNYHGIIRAKYSHSNSRKTMNKNPIRTNNNFSMLDFDWFDLLRWWWWSWWCWLLFKTSKKVTYKMVPAANPCNELTRIKWSDEGCSEWLIAGSTVPIVISVPHKTPGIQNWNTYNSSTQYTLE